MLDERNGDIVENAIHLPCAQVTIACSVYIWACTTSLLTLCGVTRVDVYVILEAGRVDPYTGI